MTTRADLREAELAALTTRLITRILSQRQVENYLLSPVRILQLAQALIKDLRRIEDNQGDGIALTKVVGYWAFWIRKTHPVTVAYAGPKQPLDACDCKTEIVDINERIALEFAVSYICSQPRDEKVIHDPFRSDCEAKCDGRQCLSRYARYMLDIHDNVFEDYLLYSMRFRTFGPHHFVMLLDQMLISACFGQQPIFFAGRHQTSASAS